MGSATYEEIREYLAGVPLASPAWLEGLYTARLSLAAVEKFVVTMSMDATSPLREAEEGVLGKEILRINRERGVDVGPGGGNGRLLVKLRAVLSPAEQTRVSQLVGGYCQPVFSAGHRFGRNGHTVMNAVRRATAAYLASKVPYGASVIEVGPDIAGWLVASTPKEWTSGLSPKYKGSRPVITPRDAVRVRWEDLAKVVERNTTGFWSEEVIDKVGVLRKSYSDFFSSEKIQSVPVRGEYIYSTDANYDIAFSDMPVVMMAVGARAWYGSINRAKGLTSVTKVKEGRLDLMGVNYRVDWAAGRIDFRHPQCTAFGYSHKVAEFMKYEENNGYLWSSEKADYIYTKCPETTSEQLFFSVVRVPKLRGLVEPRFVEEPLAGLLEINSIWAVGDEVSGVPTSFCPVRFYVDPLNFSKVLEKRRALDGKGDLAVVMALVRSTNVRMWINGVPVGANKKIESRLAEATAVVVEVLAMQGRLKSNLVFDKAIECQAQGLARGTWMWSCLESLIDFRAVVGKVVGPIARVWEGIRGSVMDKALSSLSSVKVSVALVPEHRRLGDDLGFAFCEGDLSVGSPSDCLCLEVAQVRAALLRASGEEKKMLTEYLDKRKGEGCVACETLTDRVVSGMAEEEKEEKESEDSGYESGETGDKESMSEENDAAFWRAEQCDGMVEKKSMEEFIALEKYLMAAEISELRIDAKKIMSHGQYTSARVKEFCTGRTEHLVMKFAAGRCVASFGVAMESVGAIYDLKEDKVVPVREKGAVRYAPVKDGFYYTCNRLKVWNAPELIAAVDYALDYGVVAKHRAFMEVDLGVPGAGKTYAMMVMLAELVRQGMMDFVALAVTTASVAAAVGYGKEFGIDPKVLNARVMTLDSYLMHRKFPVKLLCCDEFPMVHIGKVDAAVAVSGATSVRLFGDAKQIPYDPFCAEFPMKCATLGRSVPREAVRFNPKTHRLTEDTCAMWLDQYPAIYPCDCCGSEDKQRKSLFFEKVSSLADVPFVEDVRYHTYKRDEKEEVRVGKGMRGSALELRKKKPGGLASVHEDQGSTHKVVYTVRTSVVYDKNASQRNPSLFNRERYVLTDTTRHTKEYRYYSLCEENDLVRKRIELSRDPERLAMVRRCEGYGKVDVYDMLT